MKQIKIIILLLVISISLSGQNDEVLEFEPLVVIDTLFNKTEFDCIKANVEAIVVLDTGSLEIVEGVYGYNLGAHLVKKSGNIWFVYDLPFYKDVFEFSYSDNRNFLTYNNHYFGGGNGHFGTSVDLCIIDLSLNLILSVCINYGETFWEWQPKENETEKQFDERNKDSDSSGCISDIVLKDELMTVQNQCIDKSKTSELLGCGHCLESGIYKYDKGKFIRIK